MKIEIAIEANKDFTAYWGRTKVNGNLYVADGPTIEEMYAEMKAVIKDFEGIEGVWFEIVEEIAQ